MKINLKQRLLGAVKGYKDAFFHAPLAMILCALIGIFAMILVHEDLAEETATRIQRAVFVCVMGIPFSMLTGLLESRVKGILFKASVWVFTLAFLVFYYYVGFPAFGMEPVTRAVVLTLVFIVSYVLYYSEINHLSHEKMTLFVLQRLLFTGIYALIVWGGISFTFFAFSELMDIKLWNEAYIDFLFVTVGFLIPAYFFYGFPRKRTQEEKDVAPFITTMLSYILIPVIIAYSAVLYLYFIRLLVTFQWPEGMLGHLVFWYGLVSMAVMYFIRPFSKDKKITDLFYRYFPYVIIIPLIMMFISLGIRIKAYGFTEPRYGVGIMGFWLLLTVIFHFFKNRFQNINRWVLISLIVVALFGIIGPFSAYSVSVSSQNNQFSMIDQKYGLLSRFETFQTQEMEEQDRDRVMNILRYFDNNHSLEDLKLPDHIDQTQLLTKFDYNYYPSQPYRYVNIDSMDAHSLDIRGYDYLLGMYANDFTVVSNSGSEYRITVERTHFVISTKDREVYRKDLGEYLQAVYQKNINVQENDQTKNRDSLILPGSDLIFEDETENFKLRFFVQSAFCRVNPDGEMEVESISLYTALMMK